MQLTLVFRADAPVNFPVHYAHLIQGVIYRSMENPALRKYLHDYGFSLGKRKFKLFTFSRLLGQSAQYDKSNQELILAPPLRLIICSPIPFILQELGNGLVRQGSVRIGHVQLNIAQMITTVPEIQNDRIRIRMLSPITIYSTLPSQSDGRYTYYYSPFEPQFSALTGDNLMKKHLLIHGYSPKKQHFSITPLKVEEDDMKITRYKGFIVKGWMGEYELHAAPTLLQVALDAGLGAKNSQGYGCCSLL